VTSGNQPPITPIPIPLAELARVGAVLLVGGTFDPPHVGHTRVPAALRAAAFPDGPCGAPVWLVYVPAARSPLKSHNPVASDVDRVRMLELAISGVPSACVWTDEIDRAASGAPSYTVDTLRRARAWLDGCAPHVALRLVIGADQAAAFHRWREPREIIRLAEPLVMGRRGVGQTESILRSIHESGFWTHDEIAAWRTRIPDLRDPGVQVSSTQLRDSLRLDRDTPEHMHPEVAAYIRSHSLYR
jgi:nicotinate-nucleotide adenylyltransferase